MKIIDRGALNQEKFYEKRKVISKFDLCLFYWRPKDTETELNQKLETIFCFP